MFKVYICKVLKHVMDQTLSNVTPIIRLSGWGPHGVVGVVFKTDKWPYNFAGKPLFHQQNSTTINFNGRTLLQVKTAGYLQNCAAI